MKLYRTLFNDEKSPLRPTVTHAQLHISYLPSDIYANLKVDSDEILMRWEKTYEKIL